MKKGNKITDEELLAEIPRILKLELLTAFPEECKLLKNIIRMQFEDSTIKRVIKDLRISIYTILFKKCNFRKSDIPSITAFLKKYSNELYLDAGFYGIASHNVDPIIFESVSAVITDLVISRIYKLKNSVEIGLAEDALMSIIVFKSDDMESTFNTIKEKLKNTQVYLFNLPFDDIVVSRMIYYYTSKDKSQPVYEKLFQSDNIKNMYITDRQIFKEFPDIDYQSYIDSIIDRYPTSLKYVEYIPNKVLLKQNLSRFLNLTKDELLYVFKSRSYHKSHLDIFLENNGTLFCRLLAYGVLNPTDTLVRSLKKYDVQYIKKVVD